MEILTQFIGAPVNAVTLLIVGGILFFNLLDRGLLHIGKEKDSSITEVIRKNGTTNGEKVPEWAAKLIQYTNHETTDRLNRLIAMEEREHEQADQMREVMRDILRTLQEFREYGIPCRDKKP